MDKSIRYVWVKQFDFIFLDVIIYVTFKEYHIDCTQDEVMCHVQVFSNGSEKIGNDQKLIIKKHMYLNPWSNGI